MLPRRFDLDREHTGKRDRKTEMVRKYMGIQGTISSSHFHTQSLAFLGRLC